MHHTTLTAAFYALAPAQNPHTSALYKQTGHFVTGKEATVVLVLFIGAILLGAVIAGLKGSKS